MLGAHLPVAFSKWISRSAHFAAIAIPLSEGRRLASVAANRCRQRLRMDPQGPKLGAPFSNESDVGPVLVGSAPPTPVGRGRERGAKGEKVPMAQSSRPRGRPLKKACPVKGVPASSPPSLPNRGGADSDAMSTVSEVSYRYQLQQRHRREKCLAPAKLDLPIFMSTDSSTDITYTIWRFDVQSWLEQYTERSMKPHIYVTLRGYPGTLLGRWGAPYPHQTATVHG